LQSSGTAGLAEIGFALGKDGAEYKIYQREGYSIDEFIIVDSGGFMDMATIYAGGVDETLEISAGYGISSSIVRQVSSIFILW
jgi:hypothetical protein